MEYILQQGVFTNTFLLHELFRFVVEQCVEEVEK